MITAFFAFLSGLIGGFMGVLLGNKYGQSILALLEDDEKSAHPEE